MAKLLVAIIVLAMPGLARAGRTVEFVPVDAQGTYDPVRPSPERYGLTGELGFGLQYTSEFVESDSRLAGAFGGSIGWFVNDRTAVLLRGLVSSNGALYRGTYEYRGYLYDARVARTKTTLFIGPTVQVFPGDRFMLSGGLGLVNRRDSYDVNVYGTSMGDEDDVRNELGIGASLRAGFAIYEGRGGGAVRLTAEALPTLVNGDWGIAAGAAIEVQIY